jgi:hypothetical protein
MHFNISSNTLEIEKCQKSRIHAPVALHHVICRGIVGRPIFEDDFDRERFVTEPVQSFSSDHGKVAWYGIPNGKESAPITVLSWFGEMKKRIIEHFLNFFNKIFDFSANF